VKFEFKQYATKEELFTYTQGPDYIIDPVNNPGVCLGFEIVANSETDFEY
jgi:hypothetical protein